MTNQSHKDRVYYYREDKNSEYRPVFVRVCVGAGVFVRVCVGAGVFVRVCVWVQVCWSFLVNYVFWFIQSFEMVLLF